MSDKLPIDPGPAHRADVQWTWIVVFGIVLVVVIALIVVVFTYVLPIFSGYFDYGVEQNKKKKEAGAGEIHRCLPVHVKV
jgi:hypothetical protein